VTLKSGIQVIQGIAIPFESLGADFPFASIVTIVLSCIISQIKRDFLKIVIFFIPPLAVDAPVRGSIPVRVSPSRLIRKKTRMVWLSDSEKNHSSI